MSFYVVLQMDLIENVLIQVDSIFCFGFEVEMCGYWLF